MAKTLNLDSFNEILFGAFKDQSPKAKAEFLAVEIQTAYSMKIVQMEELVKALNEGRSYHEELKLVNNIDGNLDTLAAQLEELEMEHPEIMEEADEEEGETT